MLRQGTVLRMRLAECQERYGDIMAGIISAVHINPFLLSAQQILTQVCMIQTKVGQISKDAMCIDGEPVFIMLGVTGEMTGQVCIVFDMDYYIKNQPSAKTVLEPILTQQIFIQPYFSKADEELKDQISLHFR